MSIYCHWIFQYILFHKKRHPAEMGKPEIEAFISHLAQNRRLSSSSQNQAFNAILFLYREVLEIEPPQDEPPQDRLSETSAASERLFWLD